MPFAIPDSLSIGNTIQNTNTHNVTVAMNMMQLYNKIPYFKKVNSPPARPGASIKGAQSPLSAFQSKSKTKEEADTSKKPNKFKEIGEFLARGVMMLKNVNLTFTQQGGQGLPNFRPTSQYGGMDFNKSAAPGFLFTTGLNDPQIRERSLSNDWLVMTRNQTTPYTEIKNINYTYRSTLEPHGSLKIDLTGNYSKQLSKTSYIGFGPNLATSDPNDSTIVFDQSPNETGNFDISTFTLFRAFKDGKGPVNSKLFDQFLADRSVMAGELSEKNSFSKDKVTRDGYSKNQQDVLIGSFFRTYSGRNIKNYSTTNIFPTIPLPNWNVSWDGLGKIKPLKKTFRSITLRHGYKSSYRVSGFNNNILYNTTDPSLPQNVRMPVTVGDSLNVEPNNFVSRYNVNSVTISEAFSPLLKFDLQFVKTGWSANVETRRDKTTTLNIIGYQIVETKGQEYIMGLGYMIPRLKLRGVLIQGKAVESNLVLKLDLSFRKNLSVIRDLTQGSSTPTGGTDIITMRSSADYLLTPNINLRIFYDWIRTKPQTSASFPTSSATGGFTLRINFQ
jgi:cell surface protein SprA